MGRPNLVRRVPPRKPSTERGNNPDPKRSNSPTGSWPSVSSPMDPRHSLRSTTPVGLKPTSKNPYLPQFCCPSELLEPSGYPTGTDEAQPEGFTAQVQPDIKELQDLRYSPSPDLDPFDPSDRPSVGPLASGSNQLSSVSGSTPLPSVGSSRQAVQSDGDTLGNFGQNNTSSILKGPDDPSDLTQYQPGITKTVHIVYKAPFDEVYFQRKLSISLAQYSQSQGQGYAYIGFERHETMYEQNARKQNDTRWMQASLNQGNRQDSPMASKSKDKCVRWAVDKANPNESSRISVPVGEEGPGIVVVEWRMATVRKGKYHVEDRVERRETAEQYGPSFPPFRFKVELEHIEGDDQTHEARSTGSEPSSLTNTVSLTQVEKSVDHKEKSVDHKKQPLDQEEAHPVDARCAPS